MTVSRVGTRASRLLESAFALLLKNSDVPHFKDTLGWVSYQRQDYRTALPLLEDAAKALPNLPIVRYHLGMAYCGDRPGGQGVKTEFLPEVPSPRLLRS